jgi:cytochrome c oxidase subunit II
LTRRAPVLCVCLVGGAALAGCGGQQSALDPQSHAASDISTLFWWMTGVAAFGLALITGLLVLAYIRRHRRGIGSDTQGEKPGERLAWRVVVGGGIVMPIVLLAALFVIADIFVIQTTQSPAASDTRLTVDVIGHQWWWEVRYPGTTAVTANEIHIPARTPVLVRVSTTDVIHSFWVPQLNRKIDTIPGQDNAVELYANRAGTFRGACAEYCGLQHANMALLVVAQPPDAFRRWLAAEAAPAASTTARGASLFAADGCASCHAIRGTEASGYVGPDLTHLASRATIAALTLVNTASNLRSWIANPQHAKPGNRMPGLDLPAADVDALAAYLEGLR